MDEHKKTILRLHMEQAKKALEEHHIKTFIVKDQKEACSLANSLIKDKEKVSDGGSMTLSEIGLSDMLKKRDITYISHNEPLSKEESEQEAHDAFFADTFICSSNAVTMDGALINVDGHGNRVAAMIYGPNQVIVIIGSNKLVKNEEEAKKRIQSMAAPANCVRLKRATPCVKLGSCQDCHSKDRICNFYVKIEYDMYDRLRVILMEEEAGY
ncbi:lactate utilization protein [[Eubacterium] hominis]|uniref:lactate utilization protein n=1 Tax=[Eubacterium] hominis TaxID=2764325 RepID=UPI003A4DD735